MLGGRLAGALVPLGVEMQTKQQEKERRLALEALRLLLKQEV